jgi:hypothetical protein
MVATPATAYSTNGNEACSEIVQADDNEEYRTSNKWWIYGFFIGRNSVENTEVGEGIEPEDLYVTALEICRSSSEITYRDAVNHLFDQLKQGEP